MSPSRAALALCASATCLAGALLCFRWLSAAFGPDTTTVDHPVIALVAALIVAALAWLVVLAVLRRQVEVGAILLSALLLLGLGLRIVFFDSQPVYENDYRRYLWDGAVTSMGDNPYRYSPATIAAASEPGTASVPELARLAVLSNSADGLTKRINSPELTTIYPPLAQGVFAAAYRLAPYDRDGLRAVFLVLEVIGLGLMTAALLRFGIARIWVLAYWLNPIIIVTTYNAVHMDVLLVAPLMAALLFIRTRPFLAATGLAVAAAIKLWPLLLAPVLFRTWRARPRVYLGVALWVAVFTALACAPMLLALHDKAGLAAYSANWTNSSFLFPGLRDGLGLFLTAPDRVARYVMAALLTALSLWLGFAKSGTELIPAHLMLLAGIFVCLSPTGYPWYFIWFLMFLPFAGTHWSARGLALLTLGASAYWARFALGEAGHYWVYAKVLLPLEFGVPLLVLVHDGLKARRNG